MKQARLIALFVLVSVPSLCVAQTTPVPQLTITSPLQAQPGDNITLSVTPIEDGPVTIGGKLFDYKPDEPLGAFKESPPFDFTITVPIDVPAGNYFFIASQQGPNGTLSISKKVSVYIGTMATVTKLVVEPSEALLSFQGDQQSLAVFGVVATGQAALTGDTKTSCSSEDQTIVLVVPPCTAVALKAGATTINVSNGNLLAAIPAKVQASGVRGDFNGDGVVDQTDARILTLGLNKPLAVPGDARDLNGDGKIDALDARIEATLCTYARCASQ